MLSTIKFREGWFEALEDTLELSSKANTAHAQAAGAEAGVQVTPGQEAVGAERAVTGRALGRCGGIYLQLQY